MINVKSRPAGAQSKRQNSKQNSQAHGLAFPVAQLLFRSVGIEREARAVVFASAVTERPPVGFRVRGSDCGTLERGIGMSAASVTWIVVDGDEVVYRCRDRREAIGYAALLRRTSLSLLKNNQTAKLGMKNKRLKAAYDDDYRLEVLLGR